MDYYNSYPYGLPRRTGSLIQPEIPKDGNRVWKVTTEPIIEPVTVDEVKLFARIDTTEEDDLIEGFIQTARTAAEDYLGRAFLSQTITSVLDFWPGLVVSLPRPPLMSVTGVYIVDEDDAETEYSSDYYYLNTTAEPGQLIIKRGSTLPTNTGRDYGKFIIRSKHGYGTDISEIPRSIRNGIMLWAAVIYSTRVIDPKNPPPEAKASLDLVKTPGVMVR